MSDTAELSRRIEVIESGYEYLLAYAAQGRRDDAGSEVRGKLEAMHAALDGLGDLVTRLSGLSTDPGARTSVQTFLQAVGDDANKARGAIALVLSRPAISSLLVDNLNASIHLRALLTDLFLLEQALKA